jgi:hypothetical protein
MRIDDYYNEMECEGITNDCLAQASWREWEWKLVYQEEQD